MIPPEPDPPTPPEPEEPTLVLVDQQSGVIGAVGASLNSFSYIEIDGDKIGAKIEGQKNGQDYVSNVYFAVDAYGSSPQPIGLVDRANYWGVYNGESARGQLDNKNVTISYFTWNGATPVTVADYPVLAKIGTTESLEYTTR